MSATISQYSIGAATARPLRFGVVDAAADGAGSLWLLKRNCSLRPQQLLLFYVSLCTVSLGIALAFWAQGATLVMPFAWLEILAVGVALLLYARHAADRESIRLQSGLLTVEHVAGQHVERAEFVPGWVRIEPEHGDGSLIELSGQGQRISVGRFVRPELRRQLADELRSALRRRPDAAVAAVQPSDDRRVDESKI